MNKEAKIIRSSFVILLSLMLVVILIGRKYQINATYSRTYSEMDRFNYIIESTSIKNNVLIIEGWNYYNPGYDKNYNYKKQNLVLIDIQNNSCVIKSSSYELKDREDVRKVYNSDGTFKKYGFIVKFDISKTTQNTTYNLCFNCDRSSYAYNAVTNVYVKNNKAYNFNPNTVTLPNLENTDLSFLKEENLLSASTYYNGDVDDGIYIYQYDDKIFYVLSNKNYIWKDHYTIQFEIHIVGNEHYTDYDFNFLDNEVTNKINCGKYRVAVKDISILKNRSVTFVYSGRWYNNEDVTSYHPIRPNVLLIK